MKNEQKDLESRVWKGRLSYAIETFREINRYYWNLYTELTHRKTTVEKVIGYVGKAMWPLHMTLTLIGIPVSSMVCVKYSPERKGYIED